MSILKKYSDIIYLLAIIILIVTLVNLNIQRLQIVWVNDTDKKMTKEECERRLLSLEPEEGLNIDSYPIYDVSLPTNVKTISEVLQQGKEIPLQYVYNDLTWIRPAYKSYWHTGPSGGRWSYVPKRVNYALHRIFVTYPTTSVLYDFEGNLGIMDLSRDWVLDYNDINQVLVAVMGADVKKIVTLDNQVIVITEPKRNGIQILSIPEGVIQPANADEASIFQMFTPDGYEIDYALMILK